MNKISGRAKQKKKSVNINNSSNRYNSIDNNIIVRGLVILVTLY